MEERNNSDESFPDRFRVVTDQHAKERKRLSEKISKEMDKKVPNKRGRKKKEKVIFEPNIETLSLNSLNPEGNLPEDFFTNNSKYRKPGSEISR